MSIILGVLGWAMFLLGALGIIAFSGVGAIQAGICMLTGGVFLAGCHVAETIRAQVKAFGLRPPAKSSSAWFGPIEADIDAEEAKTRQLAEALAKRSPR